MQAAGEAGVRAACRLVHLGGAEGLLLGLLLGLRLGLGATPLGAEPQEQEEPCKQRPPVSVPGASGASRPLPGPSLVGESGLPEALQ